MHWEVEYKLESGIENTFDIDYGIRIAMEVISGTWKSCIILS